MITTTERRNHPAEHIQNPSTASDFTPSARPELRTEFALRSIGSRPRWYRKLAALISDPTSNAPTIYRSVAAALDAEADAVAIGEHWLGADLAFEIYMRRVTVGVDTGTVEGPWRLCTEVAR